MMPTQAQTISPLGAQDAQAMFTRVLRSWASDILSLRQRGLDKPGYRPSPWAEASAGGPWPFAQAKERRARAA
jgi:hypothetical protein